jgi:predicted flap endonuclease-1-like 5' DNA nuclease
VAWFVTQSLSTILLAFLLGVLVGWLWWGRQWKRVRVTESVAVQTIANRLESMVAERDTEIARLRLSAAAAPSYPHAAHEPPDPGSGTLVEPAPSPVDGVLVTLDDSAGPEVGPLVGEGVPGSAPNEVIEPTSPTPAGIEAETGIDALKAPAPADEPSSDISEEPYRGHDELTRIEGIGPRIAMALRGAGVGSFQDLAACESEQLTAALRDAGLCFGPSLITWPHQAAFLAAGDETGFQTYLKTLLADREPGGLGVPGAPAPRLVKVESKVAEKAAEKAAEIDLTGDDLERIEGIGPRISSALRKAGIRSFDALANSDIADLQSALESSGLRFAPSLPTWPKQARFLVQGDEESFSALADTLVTDRESRPKEQ